MDRPGSWTVWRRAACLLLSLIASMVLIGTGPASAQSDKFAAFVMNAGTGEIFLSTNPDRRLHPASLTKMMTLYMTFRAIERGDLTLSSRLSVSAHAAVQPPSKLGLSAGSTITVEDAILSLVVVSANDAAVVLGEALGGSESEFARMMTAEAQAIGMTRTVFRNASGLPDDRQVSTARDMAILARALIIDYASYYPYFATETMRFRGRTYETHNAVIARVRGGDGLKTGYIRASGYNLVGSAIRGDTRFIAVLFGGRTIEDRNDRVVAMLDAAFAADGGTGSYVEVTRPEPPAVVLRPLVVAASPLVDTVGSGRAPFMPPFPLRRPGGAAAVATGVAGSIGVAPPPDEIASILAAVSSSAPLPETIDRDLVRSVDGAALPAAFDPVPIPMRPPDPLTALLPLESS